MKSSRDDSAFYQHVKGIIDLDCLSLPTKIYGSGTATTSNRQKHNRIASVATIRALLVFFGNLHNELIGLSKIIEINQYYENRRLLVDRVLPESVFAFDFCREILSLKGATNTPTATKLATLTNSVGDCVELIKARMPLAFEFHELKYKIIEEIKDFSKRSEFSKSDVAPLMFSLTVGLPLRLENFSSKACNHFPDAIEHLQKLSNDATSSAKRKIQDLESKEAETIHDTNHLSESETIKAQVSPMKPKLLPIRGIKYRQPLTYIHQRIPSYKEVELQKQIKPEMNNKENHSKFQSHGTNRRIPFNNILISSSKDKNIKVQSETKTNSGSRLREPTRIENRKIVQPIMLQQISEENIQPRTQSSSKVAAPTVIQTRRSISNFEASKTPSYPEYKTQNYDTSARSTLDENISDSSYMILSSLGDETLEETPLTRKKGSGLTAVTSLQYRASNSNLHMPRSRTQTQARIRNTLIR